MATHWEELETEIISITQNQEREKRLDEANLIVLAGSAPGSTYAIQDHLLIGRGPSADVHIDRLDVSRRHAQITRSSSNVFELRDLDSRNGTRVNGRAIERHVLRYGDKISIGNVALLLFTYYDQLEAELVYSQKMEALGRLAGGIAHDFNNLLGTVLSSVAFLRLLPPNTNVQSEDVLDAVSDAEIAVRRAAELTTRLIGFARGGKYLEESIDVSELVNEVAGLLRRTVDRVISIVTEVETGLIVEGDASQLHQVLMNLGINGADAMPHGGILTLRVFRRASAVTVEVEDTGVGMDPETKRRAFDPFFSTKPSGHGTGLGLAMVYGIVRNHGGDVHVDSELGRRTLVQVTLPESFHDALPSHNRREELRNPGKMQILVVDDEAPLLNSTSRLLRQFGHEVLTAESGLTALEIYREKKTRIEVVLLDLMMPDMTGEETFAALREIDPGVQVIIVTGYVHEGRTNAILEAGAVGFIQKPFDGARLQREISRVTAAA